MLKIELLRESDLEGLKDLYNEAFEVQYDQLQPVINTFKKNIEENPHYCILCAKENEQVVGSVMGVICYELYGNCRPFMVIENVAVLKAYRRQGIAKKLMVELESYARKTNCSMILFVSSERHTGAHKLYESLGFGEDKVNGYRKRL